jgi:hypothetical protein
MTNGGNGQRCSVHRRSRVQIVVATTREGRGGQGIHASEKSGWWRRGVGQAMTKSSGGRWSLTRTAFRAGGGVARGENSLRGLWLVFFWLL